MFIPWKLDVVVVNTKGMSFVSMGTPTSEVVGAKYQKEIPAPWRFISPFTYCMAYTFDGYLIRMNMRVGD
jgi:hypothetical protein